MNKNFETYEEIPDIEGFDLKQAKIYLPKPSMFIKTVNHFYLMLSDTIDEVENLYKGIQTESGLEAYRIKVHGLKSSCATVGNVTLNVLAKLLDYAARENNMNRIHAIHPIFVEELIKANKALEEFFSSISDKEEATASNVIPLLETLKFCIIGNDLDMADSCIARLGEFSYPANLQEDIHQLIAAEAQLREEDALDLADKIIEVLNGGV